METILLSTRKPQSTHLQTTHLLSGVSFPLLRTLHKLILPDLFYGRIFSFDEILDDIETGHVIISALIGIDCHPQMKHHMIGMLINGVTREEIESTRSLCYKVAETLKIKFRHPAGEIPSLSSAMIT